MGKFSMGLMQERRNSIAYTLELRLSCTDLSFCEYSGGASPWTAAQIDKNAQL